ncbi:MAG: CsbD family protein [Pseudomonadota bacterium]
MNTNQLHGSFRNLAGKIQEQAGRLLGSRTQELRGLQRQVLGRAETKLGNFQAAARRTIGHSRGIHL